MTSELFKNANTVYSYCNNNTCYNLTNYITNKNNMIYITAIRVLKTNKKLEA